MISRICLLAFALPCVLAQPVAAVTLGGSLPYEVGARDRAKMIGVIAQAHANDKVVREQVNVVEIYGADRGRPLECNAAVSKFDASDLLPGQRPELNTVTESVINVCLGQ